MNTTVDTYLAINGWSNATNGSDTAKKNELKQNVTDAQSKIKKLETDIATYISSASDWLRDSREWMARALEDIKDRHRVDENINRRDGGGHIKAGRKARYESRWDNWKGSEQKSIERTNKANALKGALATQLTVLEQAKKVLEAYEEALAKKIALGYSENQASEEADLIIQQEEAKLDAIQQKADAEAEAVLIGEKQKLTKILIVSGAIAVIILGVVIFRQK